MTLFKRPPPLFPRPQRRRSAPFGKTTAIYRRALILSGGRVRQILDAELGTGLRPVVLMSDGTLRVRATTEGTPIVLGTDMRRRTLAAGETLLI
jgi:hypothetical protein